MSESFFKFRAWLIHLTTACGALVALFGYYAISQQNLKLALMLMLLTIIIDAIDGPLARFWKVKHYAPNYDGARLDYIVDFSTWVLLPAFYILNTQILMPAPWSIIASCMIVLSSCYQFCCIDLKAAESNFKRWPSAWSLMIILMAVWQSSAIFNFIIILACCFFSFIPTSYFHPFQKNQFSNNPSRAAFLNFLVGFMAALFLISMIVSIMLYPIANQLMILIQQGVLVFYVICSLYNTYREFNN